MFFLLDDQPYKCKTKDYFWFNEVRQAISAIVDDGISIDNLSELSTNCNFFNAASKARAKETASGVIRRLKVADEAFFSFFMLQFVQDQKILNMVLIMLENRSMYEFMNEVFKEKLVRIEEAKRYTPLLKRLIVAEKKSVGQEIAKTINCIEKIDGNSHREKL